MKRRRLFEILNAIWNRIYKQLTKFSLRFNQRHSKYMDAEYQELSKLKEKKYHGIPTFVEKDLFPNTSLDLSTDEESDKSEYNEGKDSLTNSSPEWCTDIKVQHHQPISTEQASHLPAVKSGSSESAPNPSTKKGPLRLAVDQIPIIEVAKRYGWVTGPIRKGSNNIQCPLPTHRSSNHSSMKKGKGSFVIDTDRNTARCWKCGTHTFSDAASLLAAVRGERKQWTATLILARDFQLISEQVFQSAMNGARVLPADIQESVAFEAFKPIEEQREMLNYVNIDRVYRCLMLTYKLTAPKHDQAIGFLSKEDFNYLHHSRGMSIDSITKGQFFTFPKPQTFKTFVDILMHNKIILSMNDLNEILKGVPGFYFDCTKKTWTFKYKNGIAIPIKNADGLIIGIQTRNSDKEMARLAAKNPDSEPSRYGWFSSAKDAKGFSDDRLYGISPGSPIDVIKPDVVKSNVLFITEGHFKAQKIAETFNCVALSVQGVTTFKGIEVEIQRLIEQGCTISHIYLAYDADLSYKPSVFRSSQETMDLLANCFPHLALYYVGWDVHLGKGIDDLIEAGHKERLSKLPRQMFENLCLELHQKLNETTNEWKDEDMIAYYNQNILSHFPVYSSN